MIPIISVEHLSKVYKLGQIGTGTFTNDLKVWWARARGKPNPLLRIGEVDHGNRAGEELWALRDVSFTVEQGEVLGVIGRNGAGKSTLLKILSRVTAPTSGRVRVKGRIASLLEVGTGFHPELTGRENIYLNGAILGMKRAEIDRKFDEIVDFAEIEKFIDTPVKRYSSGMYVRLAFAVAAHLESEILLVDEVLAVGDAEFQKKCLGKMGDVATQEGRTVLFVSHNLLAVKALCTRGLYLCSGGKNIDDKIEIALSVYQSSIEKAKQTEISKRVDRSGMGLVQFKNIELFCNEIPTTTISIGKSVKFIFSLTEAWSESSTLIFTIYDQYDQAIATFDSSNTNDLEQRIPKRGSIVICEFKDFPLYPGRYRVNVEIVSNKDVMDHIENAFYFEVEPGQIEGRYIQANTYGKVYIKHEWKFSDCI